MKKLIFLVGLAAGFVLGSRTGRAPYEKLEEAARRVADDPRVQEKAEQARDAAVHTAHDLAETVQDKAPEVAGAVKSTATDLAGSAKEKAGAAKDTAQDKASEAKDKAQEKKDEKSSGTHRADDADSRPDAGGDAEVGDHELKS